MEQKFRGQKFRGRDAHFVALICSHKARVPSIRETQLCVDISCRKLYLRLAVRLVTKFGPGLDRESLTLTYWNRLSGNASPIIL